MSCFEGVPTFTRRRQLDSGMEKLKFGTLSNRVLRCMIDYQVGEMEESRQLHAVVGADFSALCH